MTLLTENRASWFERKAVWTALALGVVALGRRMIDGFASREMDTRDGSHAGAYSMPLDATERPSPTANHSWSQT